MKYSKSRYCRNCHYPLAYKARFCAHCGQKDTDGRVRVGDLLQQLFFRVFKMESKYFLILWHLFIPGKVSIAYFQGKQKRYPPPVQFFFVVMVFFLFTLSKLISPENIMVNAKEGGIMVGEDQDSIYQRITLSSAVRRLHEEERQYLSLRSLRQRYDAFPDSLRSAATDEAIDSLLNPKAYGFSASVDTITLPMRGRELKIAASELYTLEPDSLLSKYQITNWRSRFLVRQELKFYTDPIQLARSFIGNLTWTFFVLIALMAGVLRLLYWRQHRFYVEHFVFLLHQHTANFLILALGIWMEIAGWANWWWWTLVSSWMITANWRALRLFYGESVFWTTFKFVLFSFAYLIFFFLLFVLGLVVVFLIF
ncbi:MAG TPA: DUF3667 domain-containing protein [Saprospiraceae bacterium]|nr:DUF3667 domain-containing protein [Saprospiraceae bacterium]